MPTTGPCANCGIESTTLTTRGRYPGWCKTCRQYMAPFKTRRITADNSPAVRANRQALEAWLKQHQHITAKLKSKSNTPTPPPERLEPRPERPEPQNPPTTHPTRFQPRRKAHSTWKSSSSSSSSYPYS